MGRPKKTPEPANRAQRRHPELVSETADLIARRQLWPITEAAYQLGVSRQTMYRKLWAGDIKFVNVGRRVFVTDSELRRFVANLEAAAS